MEAGGTAIDVGCSYPALDFAVSITTDAASRLPVRTILLSSTVSRWCSPEKRPRRDIIGLWEMITAERWMSGSGNEASDSSVLQRYRDAIISHHKLERPVTVVVDCGNGVGSVIAVSTLRGLGAEVTPLFCESDGSFPNHHPDPRSENLRDLQAAVRRTGGAWIASTATRPDGAVDETARSHDDSLVSWQRRCAPVRAVDRAISTSMLRGGCGASGSGGHSGHVEGTGHSMIRPDEGLKPPGRRVSGHMFFGGDYLGFDDALSGRRLLEGVTARPSECTTWRIDQALATPEIRARAQRRRSLAGGARRCPLASAIRHTSTCADTFPKGGALRASNTQTVL